MSPAVRPALRHTTPAWVWLLATAMVLLQATLAWTAARTKSMTSDEIAHLTGGIALWNGDYRLVPENGNLPQRVGSLPAVFAGVRLPPPESPYQKAADVWMIGFEAWFKTPGQDHLPILNAGRAVMTVFLMGVGTMVFWWARRWWGDLAGLVALAATLLSPNLLAHGALMTSDMAATLLLPLCAGLFWWHLHRDSWPSLAVTTLAVGFACIAKYSAVLLVPTFFILAIIWLFSRHAGLRRNALLRLLREHTIMALGALAIIWCFHGWRYQPVRNEAGLPSTYIRSWEWALGAPASLRREVFEFCRHAKIFPEAYTYGAAYMTRSADKRLGFLNGEVRSTGWRSFFGWAFIFKTPWATLALASFGLIAIMVRWRSKEPQAYADPKFGPYAAAPLLVWSVVYGVVVINSHLNIGHRHILPLYPGLFILCGAVVTAPFRWLRASALGALALLALTSYRIRPHYIGYFNPWAGGPVNGWRHLVDSSLDWGQDLPELSRWLQSNATPAERVYLSYFGPTPPAYYGIQAFPLTIDHTFTPWHWFPLREGIYAISATNLQLYNGGAWTPDRERAYSSTRAHILPYEANPALFDSKDFQQRGLLALVEKERFSRLCHVLRNSEPIAHAGYSILIYRLTEAEARLIDLANVPQPARKLQPAPQ